MISSGSSIDDAIEMITDAASGWLVAAEDEGNEIPAPTPQHKLDIPENATCSLSLMPVMQDKGASSEDYDRNEKMQIYCKVGVSEYWIVDWRKKQVEIYMFDWKDNDTAYPYLYKTVTEQNKDELQVVMFPGFKITFDELSDIE